MLKIKSLYSAFDAVKANHGCAGVDGVTIAAFEKNLNHNLAALQDELDRKSYIPRPLMQILVAKKNGEPRKLCIPCVRDRIVHRAILDQISPTLEKEFEDCSYAYRSGRSVKQVVYKIKTMYNQGYKWVVDADIDAFFDNVDHSLLEEKLNRFVRDENIRTLLKQWIPAEVWDGKSLEIIEKGIPQGSAISPVLANLFLDELDEAMLKKGYRYIRYADDYVCLCKSRREALNALALSKEVLDKLELELDEEDVRSFDEGFKYLGVVFLKSMVMKPFETQKKKRNVLYFPPPFNMDAWLLKKKKNW